MGVGAAIGRWVAGIALVGVVALAVSCGGEDPPEQVRDLTPSSTPSPTATSQRTTTPTATATATAPPPPSPRSPTPTVLRSPSPSPGPALTAAQLRQALLTENDLGRDWGEIESGVLTQERNPAVYAQFADLFADQYLEVELHYDRAGFTDYAALLMLANNKVEGYNQLSPTGPGEDRVRYRYELVEDGDRLYGEVVAWRQGTVVVAMLAEGPAADVCVCDLGRRQDDKLRATLLSIR